MLLNTGSLSSGAAAAAAIAPAKQVQLELGSEVQVQVCWQVDFSHFEFQGAITNFEVAVLKQQRPNLKPYCHTCPGSKARGGGGAAQTALGVVASC